MTNLVARLSALLLIAFIGFSPSAGAQTYPVKPITYIVPSTPGGPTDLFSRVLAHLLSSSIGQPVVVENVAGASGAVAMNRIARAAPDGYTIGLGVTGALAINKALLGDRLTYNPVTDFSPVTLTANFVNVLVIDPKLPINSIADLVAYAKANPTKINFGSAGNGASNHLSGELLKKLTGAPMEHVAYKGNSPALADVMAGRLTFMFDSLNTSVPMIRAGRVRAIAVTSSVRSQYLPEVPTIAEAGLPGFAQAGSDLWFGIVGPANMPPAVVEKLNTHLVQILKSPEMKQKVEAQFLDVRWSTPEEFKRVIETDNAKWAKIVKDARVRVD